MAEKAGLYTEEMNLKVLLLWARRSDGQVPSVSRIEIFMRSAVNIFLNSSSGIYATRAQLVTMTVGITRPLKLKGWCLKKI